MHEKGVTQMVIHSSNTQGHEYYIKKNHRLQIGM